MIYVFLAKGFEEIEALSVVDFLRRAELEVCTVGVGGKIIVGSHDIPVFADLDEDEVQLDENLDAVILPGGMPGTLNLEASKTVKDAVNFCAKNQKTLCAICAAPSILGHWGLLNGVTACCFPGFESELDGANVSNDFVCIDKNIITGKGMGCALKFAHAIAEKLCGKREADRIMNSLQCSL